MAGKLKASAIIPAYNSSAYIGETIESLLSQSVKFREIIIVDNGSSDSLPDFVKGLPVRYFALEKAGRSTARNFGARKAKGNIIAFIESDSIYSKNWLAEVLKGFKKGFSAVIDQRRVFKPETFIARMNDDIFKARSRNYEPFNAWIFDRKKFLALGGFDESLECAEDKELGDRVIKSWGKVFFAKKAVQYHKGEPKNLAEALKRSLWFGSNIKFYWQKRPEETRYFKVFSFAVLPFLLVFLPALVAWVLLMMAFLLVKDLKLGLQKKFIPVHLLYSFFTEFVFSWAFLFSKLFGFSRKMVR